MREISSTTTAQDFDTQMAALYRLWRIANGHSGQCKTVACFLLGLYNGTRFPFDLTDFRVLDEPIFHDCLQVLKLDNYPEYEVHDRLGVPGATFEHLADTWGIADRSDTVGF